MSSVFFTFFKFFQKNVVFKKNAFGVHRSISAFLWKKIENPFTKAEKDVIIKICDEYHDKFEKRGIKLILKLKKYGVYQNLFLVEKIIRNLIDNALKFTKTKILIGNVKGCFWIIDNGIGIDKTVQKHIFDDFFQCKELTCENDGVGLGLGIVNCSVKLIDANINFKSKKNSYTIFRVCL